jgi:hypothetical protein
MIDAKKESSDPFVHQEAIIFWVHTKRQQLEMTLSV